MSTLKQLDEAIAAIVTWTGPDFEHIGAQGNEGQFSPRIKHCGTFYQIELRPSAQAASIETAQAASRDHVRMQLIQIKQCLKEKERKINERDEYEKGWVDPNAIRDLSSRSKLANEKVGNGIERQSAKSTASSI